MAFKALAEQISERIDKGEINPQEEVGFFFSFQLGIKVGNDKKNNSGSISGNGLEGGFGNMKSKCC